MCFFPGFENSLSRIALEIMLIISYCLSVNVEKSMRILVSQCATWENGRLRKEGQTQAFGQPCSKHNVEKDPVPLLHI